MKLKKLKPNEWIKRLTDLKKFAVLAVYGVLHGGVLFGVTLGALTLGAQPVLAKTTKKDGKGRAPDSADPVYFSCQIERQEEISSQLDESLKQVNHPKEFVMALPEKEIFGSDYVGSLSQSTRAVQLAVEFSISGNFAVQIQEHSRQLQIKKSFDLNIAKIKERKKFEVKASGKGKYGKVSYQFNCQL